MGKICLKVLKDFHKKDIKEGEILSYFEGKLKVIDLKYKNEHGEFILCEYLQDEEEMEDTNSKWTENSGISPNKDNPYEIIGSIHIPGYRNILAGIGYFVKDRINNEVLGLSYNETWKLLYNEGATNAEATSSRYGNLNTKLISTVEDIPDLDSHYWKINVYDEKGKQFAPLTKNAEVELKKGYKHTIRNRISDQVRNITFSKPEISEEKVQNLINAIDKSKKIVVLTGAGISTMSGIPDYRSAAEGLWMKNPRVLNHLNQKTFETDPTQFWNSFYHLLQESLSSIVPFPIHDALLATIDSISPNEGHNYLSWLEKNYNKEVTIITQNVDGLHQKAGSKHVIEIHGNIQRCICPECYRNYEITEVLERNSAPKCSNCDVALRPNVVFFGDQVMQYDEAVQKVEEADLFIVAGTSLQVYPFNQLLNYNKKAKTVLINGSQEPGDEVNFDVKLYGNISSITRILKKEQEARKGDA